MLQGRCGRVDEGARAAFMRLNENAMQEVAVEQDVGLGRGEGGP